MLVVVLSLGALAFRRKTPWLAVGWFWFLVTLVPVIGLLPYGASPYADRYMYLPGMGLSLAVAWTLVSLPLDRTLRVSLCAALLLACAGLSGRQVGAWHDNWSLFARKMRVFPNDAPTFSKAGEWLLGQGDLDRAITCYRDAVRLAPDRADYYYNLGSALMDRNPEEAAQWLQKAVKLNPNDGPAWTNLGCALMSLKRLEEALPPLREGVRLQPNDANARVNLGVALLRSGNREEARAAFGEALALDPANAAAKANLGLLR